MAATMTRWSLALIAALLVFPGPAMAGEPNALYGRVATEAGAPIPGLDVYLVDLTIGRSRPATTNSAGEFIFPEVPANRREYFVEVYWGRTLMYRNVVRIAGQVDVGTIRLGATVKASPLVPRTPRRDPAGLNMRAQKIIIVDESPEPPTGGTED